MARKNRRIHVENMPILVEIARIFHTEPLKTIEMHMKTTEISKMD